MGLNHLVRGFKHTARANSSQILSASAGVGTLVTAYLAGRASWKACDVIRTAEAESGTAEDRKQRYKERAKLVWKLYIPPAISATSTVAFLVTANRVELKKTIAAQTAFLVSEQAYSDYRKKVVEEIGEKKDKVIKDAIAEEKVQKTAPPSNVLMSGPGNVLCCEMYSGRYFTGDMETLRQAVNELNHKMLTHDYATLDDFYDLIGLKRTTASGELGWKSSKLMQMDFSTVLTEDGRPCLAFEYNYVEPV